LLAGERDFSVFEILHISRGASSVSFLMGAGGEAAEV